MNQIVTATIRRRSAQVRNGEKIQTDSLGRPVLSVVSERVPIAFSRGSTKSRGSGGVDTVTQGGLAVIPSSASPRVGDQVDIGLDTYWVAATDDIVTPGGYVHQVACELVDAEVTIS